MRNLASIQKISDISDIEGSDYISKARVLGWNVIVKRGEFKVGDFVIYCEIDSLLPICPSFEFLRGGSYKAAIKSGDMELQREGFRIKTKKIRGIISQGLCLPIDILPTGTDISEGMDVTEILGIIKYENESSFIESNTKIKTKGNFPSFIRKTDETRVQTLEKILEKYRGIEFGYTEKLDGQSFTCFIKEEEFGVCSRNILLNEEDLFNTFSVVARSNDLKNKLISYREKTGKDIFVQGEVIGPNIQNNKYKLKDIALYVFNVGEVKSGRYFDRDELVSFCKEYNLLYVPHIGVMKLDHGVDDVISMSEGKSVINSNIEREGLVFRPLKEIQDDYLGRLSFKAINPKFLLKFDE